jgi:hypothetical protein
MHLILTIFKKDIRRLWWGVAIALLIQIAAAWMDAVDNVAADALNDLLIVTWAVLIALAVHEDPLVGDRQFWITRPARWRVLLASKLLFALAVVHAPSFLADIAVLAARGFNPWEWLPSLLTRQLLLAAALTLPTIALAAVLRSFAHLALAAIGILGVTFLASFLASNLPQPLFGGWTGDENLRFVLLTAAAASGAIAVAGWQFARRRTWRARLVGIASVLGAELIFAFVSPVFLIRVRAAFDPAPARISFHVRNVAPTAEAIAANAYADRQINAHSQFFRLPGFVAMSVPLGVSGIPKGIQGVFGGTSVDIIAPGGERLQLRPSYIGRDRLNLEMPRSSYQRLKYAKVELQGTVPAILYRVASSISLPVGVRWAIPGMGRCATDLFELPGLNPGAPHRFVRIVCESPQGSPLPAFVNFWESADSNRGAQLDWRNTPLLSPLVRATASFPLSPGEDPRASGRFEVTHYIPQGWQVVNLGLHDLRLADYFQNWSER